MYNYMDKRYAIIIVVMILVFVGLYRHMFYNPFYNKNVIVVGNSRELLKAEKGEEIDSNYDMIIRLNHFKIEGYEKYTGTRTDGMHMNYVSTPPERTQGLLKNNDIKWMGTRDKIRFCGRTGVSILDKRVFQYDKNSLPCRSPTSGTAVIADIVKYCNRPITIVGLGGYSEPGYYYDEKKHILNHNWNTAHTKHCPAVEQNFIDKLIKNGKVRRLMDD